MAAFENIYANAFLNIDSNSNFEEIEQVILFCANLQIRKIIETPIISKNEKYQLINETNFKPTIKNLIKTIIHNNREKEINKILIAIQNNIYERNNQTLVKVTSASTLDSKVKQVLEQKLESLTNKKNICLYSVEPSLVAGIKIEYNNRLIDNSLIAKRMRLIRHIQGELND